MSTKPKRAVDTAIAEAKAAEPEAVEAAEPEAVEAVEPEAEEAPPRYGTIALDGVEYGVRRKPSSLMLAELARTGSGDPEALAVLADFFEVTLGKDYPAFKRAVYRSDAEDIDEVLRGLLAEVIGRTLGRPTE